MAAAILRHGIRVCAVLCICAGLAPVAPGAGYAATPEQSRPVAPAGRQAVVYGQITDVRRDGLTIRFGTDEIRVDAKSLSGTGSLHDFYDTGMFVTVEGTLTRSDEIVASAITLNTPYAAVPNRPAVPPYVAQGSIITPEQLQ